MHDVSVAFVWHQHQPYYPDDVAGVNAMPWVRLHGTKDYWGMAMHLREVPEVRATINLVPSLIAQIRAYTESQAVDEPLRISRLPADSLGENERLYLLDHFFMANQEHMIRPHARYHELYQQRGLGIDTAARASRRFSVQDLLDLQVWSNLVWFHPIAFERDSDLADFFSKGRHWSEDEKQWLLDKQMAVLGEVIPLHRQLAASGQVELTTTPFYHPILPLLIDKRLAREALPQIDLPRQWSPCAEDALAQLQRAAEYHAEVFGIPARGLWPSEGSVAQAMVPLAAKAGFAWMASDEEVLAHSLEGRLARDANGFVQNPQLLYRPWVVEQGEHKLQMIFRDHALSDLIGFQYQRAEPAHAAADLIGKLQAIGASGAVQAGRHPPLVSIILDGENCWEYYPRSGVEFMRAMYRGLARTPQLQTVRVDEYLERYPAREPLQKLFAGSWISHNFRVWIGHPACNFAWDLLAAAREMLVAKAASGAVSSDNLSRAWEELYIAEGSDWFWWFDDSHSSSQDWLFDQLFRKHLQNVYALIGAEPPQSLLRQIGGDGRSAHAITQPTGLLEVKVDGRHTYFEWINAGTHTVSAGRGTMNVATVQRVERLHFGFDDKRLLLRLDVNGSARAHLNDVKTLRVIFSEPRGAELAITNPTAAKPRMHWLRGGKPTSAAGVQFAVEAILEIAIPWRGIDRRAEDALHFYVELVNQDQSVERVPLEGAIETSVPSPDFEWTMWQA